MKRPREIADTAGRNDMAEHVKIAILGAGLSGLSTSYHLGHPKDAVIFEAKSHHGGHVHSETVDGFTWDDGPHISFTSNEYIKTLFSDLVGGEYVDLYIKAVNYYQGHWIDHPAQTSLWQIPEPLRKKCLDSFLDYTQRDHEPPKNYEQWLHQAMGPVFADTFPAAYTRKYWTCEPKNMDVDWIGMRILRPEKDDVVNSYHAALPETMYYVNSRSSRYPKYGGFWAYCDKLAQGANIRYNTKLVAANFSKKWLRFSDGTEVTYDRLVSSAHLQHLIPMLEDATDELKTAGETLTSSVFYRLDFHVNHAPKRDELWVYVYDEDKLSVRISVTEKFAESNAPAGKTGIQVEVYGSKWKALPPQAEVQRRVIGELIELGLIENESFIERKDIRLVPTGQIVYDLNRKGAIREVNQWLDKNGIIRVGRYSEWKYLMSDTCVLGGRRAAQQLMGKDDDTDWRGVAITADDVPEDAASSSRS
jgi:protoporphyrinogen oxidase